MAGQLGHLSDGVRVGAGHGAQVQLAVALLLHLRDHPLEGGAAAEGGEGLGGDAVSNALQTLLHKGFTLKTRAVRTVSINMKVKALACEHLHEGQSLTLLELTSRSKPNPVDVNIQVKALNLLTLT